jgi:shikimate kinase
MANIVLIGMRGSGKSSIGKHISKTANLDFIDTDELIENKAQLSIPEIVKQHGWDNFRELEAQIIQELNINNSVISTGGGVILNPNNTSKLKGLGTVVYLEASPEILAERTKNSDRPPLKDGLTLEQELTQLLDERQELYSNAADITINVNQNSDNKHQDRQAKAELVIQMVNLYQS